MVHVGKGYERVAPEAHVSILKTEGIKIGSPIEKKTLLRARTKASHTNNHQNHHVI